LNEARGYHWRNHDFGFLVFLTMISSCFIWAAWARPIGRFPETPEERLLCGVLVLIVVSLALLLARPLAMQWRKLPTRARRRADAPTPPGRRWARFWWEPEGLKGFVTLRRTFHRADFAGEDLTGAELDSLILSGADLTAARLSRARLVRTQLINACLSRADLTGASLREANLSGANLKGACLVKVNLAGAKLEGADLTDANLNGARYDRRTRWPAAFDPAKHGALLVE
jgi:pentapeptide repeat protein